MDLAFKMSFHILSRLLYLYNSFLICFSCQAYIQENPGSVKVMCFIVGLVLLIFSILGVINPFAVFSTPKDYLANIYNIIFAAPCYETLQDIFLGFEVACTSMPDMKRIQLHLLERLHG